MNRERIDLRNGYTIDYVEVVDGGHMVTLTVLNRKPPQKRRLMAHHALLIAGVSFVVCAAIVAGAARSATAEAKNSESLADSSAASIIVEDTTPDWDDPQEDEKITAALVAQGYFREDIPLTYEEQDFLHTAAEEFGVDYHLMLGLVERETNFRNIPGDGGNAYGYCQVWPKWWSGLMEEIGAEDLNDPYDNFRTACAIVAHLTEKHGSTERALTAYNSGKPGQSRYASAVLTNAEKWRAGAWQ